MKLAYVFVNDVCVGVCVRGVCIVHLFYIPNFWEEVYAP